MDVWVPYEIEKRERRGGIRVGEIWKGNIDPEGKGRGSVHIKGVYITLTMQPHRINVPPVAKGELPGNISNMKFM